ncbi:penicillin-binding protein 2 [Micrococcales bacterium 31B]|nr:penicillin-binding protein 2 [Micrococcales bacterium 31B]
MNRPLRRVAIVISIMFGILLGATTIIQAVQAPSLNADPRNVRTLYSEFGRARGAIIVNGNAVASSVSVDDSYGYQREYADGPLYAAVTGYYSVIVGRSGLENSMNEDLNGNADALFYQRISSLLSGNKNTGATVELTIDPATQQAAADALGDQRGAVVALDVTTGKILAMYSSPTYDPNQLASHDGTAVTSAWQTLTSDPANPLINRAIGGDLYPPGSVFKLVTAAAALESGKYTPNTEIPGPASITLPGTSTSLPNDSGAACGANDESTLGVALAQSCNTSFANLGMELGAEALATQAEKFGFGAELQVPMAVTPSTFPQDLNEAQLAQSSIGQFDVRVTPLQIAMISQAIANEGNLMEPTLINSVRTSSLEEITRPAPKSRGQAVSATTASALTEMMTNAVSNGTATQAAIPGITVAGKTGTAEWQEGKRPQVWFTGFAPANDPKVAVAVVVEEGGNASDGNTYGGTVAAPIAAQVMKAALGQ